MALHLWLTFCAVNFLTSLTPGPGALASVNASLSHGFRQAMRLVIGLQAALLLQLSIVGVGASALLAVSDTVFQVLRWAGAFYLIWLGLSELRKALTLKRVTRAGRSIASAASATAAAVPGVVDNPGLFSRGMLVNLSNPKAILFQAALVPHFIDVARALLPQYLIIAVTMCVIDTVVMGFYVYLAQRLAGRRRVSGVWPACCFGCLFICFGVTLLCVPGNGHG